MLKFEKDVVYKQKKYEVSGIGQERKVMKLDNFIQIRLNKLRIRMQEENINAWLVLSSDYHNSEYVGQYFKCREYISGFTGSAGNILILQKEAGLWTDGRYFLQAEKELQGSGITLFRNGEENVPELEDYLAEKLQEHSIVGVDGRTISISAYRKLKKKLHQKQIRICLDADLVGDIWQDRPKMSCHPVWELDLCYSGVSRIEKIESVRKKLDEECADYTIISSLEDIAWTLNIRGNDIACTPVVISYLIIGKTSVLWFVQLEAVDKELEEKLNKDGIILQNYFEINQFLAKNAGGQTVYLDPNRTNMSIYEILKRRMDVSENILEGKNLTLVEKSIKNKIEIENIRQAHMKDAVACIKFIYWLKKQINDTQNDIKPATDIGKETRNNEWITEISVAEKLEEYRAAQEHYLGPSFETIVGYAHHGAVVHYHATPETNLQLKPENLVLIDSGGHYLEGTTDITRTIALGELTWEQKHCYTLVLKGNLRLAAAKFRYGCAGINLDALARQALWKEGMDYEHGTGHGVGYLLNVHEAPNSFRRLVSENREECMRLEPGMITSNEPGVYFPGKFGIRLENLIVCKELEKNEFGRFLGFETLTLVPFERDAILVEELEAWEKEWLNQYHAHIIEKIGRYLEPEILAWLKEVTAKL